MSGTVLTIPLHKRSPLLLVSGWVLLCLCYLVVAALGEALAFQASDAPPIWPSLALSVCALVLFGPSLWPGVLAGAWLTAWYSLDRGLITWATAGPAGLIGAAATGEAAAAAILTRRIAPDHDLFRSPGRTTLFVFVVGAGITMLGSLAASLVVYSYQGPNPGPFLSLWLNWWSGNATRILTVIPMVLVWSQPGWREWVRGRWMELAGLMGLMFALVAFTYLAPIRVSSDTVYPMQYLTVPAVGYAVYRFGPRVATFSLFALVLVGAYFTVRGQGPFAAGSVMESLLVLQVFAVVMAAALLVFTAVIEGQQRAEAEVQRQSAHLAGIVDAIADPMCMVDASGRIIWSNARAEGVFGPGLTGLSCGKARTLRHTPWHDSLCQRVFERSLRVDEEVDLVLPGHGPKSWWCTASPAGWASDGAVQRVVLVARDITARKEQEEALRASQLFLEKVIQYMPVMMLAWDHDERVVAWNDEAARVFGYEAEEMIGREDALAALCPGDAYRARMYAEWKRRGNNFREWEWRLARRDGSPLVVSWSNVSALCPIEGWATWGVGVDVTERRAAEQRLRYYEMAVEGSGDLIAALDTEYRFILVNEAFCKYHGIARSAILGCTMVEMLGPEAFSGIIKTRVDIALEGMQFKFEISHEFPGLGLRHLQVHHSPLRTGSGEVVGMVAVMRDMTAVIETGEALAAKEEEARRLATRLVHLEESERSRIASDLHDHIGQMITALGINLNTLEGLVTEHGGAVLERFQDTQDLVRETAGAIREVIADLRPSVLDDYGLPPALEAYCRTYEERTQIPVVIERGGDAFPRLPAETETALYRIAQEALTNVAKHARADSVKVRYEGTPGRAVLCICDDGQGFETAHPDRQAAPGEGGWGLITMRERALAVGGDLIVESAPGRGTRVEVRVRRSSA